MMKYRRTLVKRILDNFPYDKVLEKCPEEYKTVDQIREELIYTLCYIGEQCETSDGRFGYFRHWRYKIHWKNGTGKISFYPDFTFGAGGSQKGRIYFVYKLWEKET